MAPYRLELATSADDADLRRILAATPMPARIAVSFEREPSYFAAAAVEGHCHQVVVCRDLATGRLVGFGARSLRRAYVNGQPTDVGYLSGLRLLPEHRKRGLVPRGFRFFKELHRDGKTPLYLTTIAEGNDMALSLLTSARAGLPRYHPAGRYFTLALSPRRRRGKWSRNSACGSTPTIRPATSDDLPRLFAFLDEEGPRRQFFPCYQANDWRERLRDLRPEDVLLAWRSGDVVGTLAGWNQTSYRQIVVHGYSGWLRCLLPFYNLVARPRLPAAGQAFRFLTAALPVARDQETFALLLAALCERAAQQWDHVLVGLAEGDPLLPVLREHSGTWYTTRVFHVGWQDCEVFRQELDGRALYLELGSL